MKKQISILLVSAALAFANSPNAITQITASNPEVTTQGVKVKGIYKNAVAQFLGIPYAKAPVGELRWAESVMADLKVFGDEFVADKFGSECSQNADLGVFAKAGGSEDCLSLSIYAPKDANKGAKKPVMVWIHGGSIWVGSGNHYDGSKIALLDDKIVVSINYRLEILGFFAHPEVSEPNLGLMDQRLAIKWTKDNIANFGGDPDNVLVFGESSGGTSIFSHIVSPLSKGLFHHAIIMSGSSLIKKYPAFGSPYPLDVAREKATRFSEAHNCKTLDCLRELSTDEILATQTPYLINNTIVGGQIYAKNATPCP